MSEALRFFRLIVPCRRVITVMPVKRAKTMPSEWELARVQGASGLHACRSFWKSARHDCPDVVSIDGRPLTRKRLRFRDLRAVEIA